MSGLELGNIPKDDLTGRTFGYLTVIKMAITEKSKGGRWRAICSCRNCGNQEYDADPQAIKNSLTTSCGCRRDQYEKISGKNNKNFNGYEEIRGQEWWKLRNRAKKRGQEFSVTIESAWRLYLKQEKKCAITGLPIRFGVVAKTRKETTASLDRINPNLGYIDGNVQWVHKDVNVMKNMFNQRYFIEVCKMVAKKYAIPSGQEFSPEEVLSLKTNYFGDKMRNRQ